MKLNLKTTLFFFLTTVFSQANAQTVQLVPDSCTFCLFKVSDGGTGWYDAGYSIFPDEDTVVLGNTYIQVNNLLSPKQPFAIRQVGNKLFGVVADSLSEYLLMDFDADITDTIHQLYSEGFFYDAVVLNKDSVGVNNGVFHHFMELNGIGFYTQSGFSASYWDLVWNERALCGVNQAIGDLGGVLFNIPSDLYSISIAYAYPQFCTTDSIYNNPSVVTCLNCNAQTNGLGELISSRLEIIPNPATNQITVQIENSVISKLRIHDIHGVKVKELEMDSKEGVIQVSELTEGLYFLSIDTDKGLVLSRFIKI